MSTVTQICNKSLKAIGSLSLVTDIDDTSPRAVNLLLHYDGVMGEVLMAHPWKWASKLANITEDGTAPAFGEANRFPVPSDYVRMIKFNGIDQDNDPEDLYDTVGAFFHTDETVAKIQYVHQVLQTASGTDHQTFLDLMPATFEKALVTKLASAIATNTTKDGRRLTASLIEQYATIDLPEARRYDAEGNKRRPYDQRSESRVIASRRFSTMG